VASEIKIVGSVNAGPSNPTGSTNLASYVDLAVDKVYPSVASGNVTIAGTDLDPFVIEGFAATRVLAFRAVDGDSFKLLLTSALGTDQAVPCSDLVLVHVPKTGDELTAIKVVGSGRVEYFVAGS